jgi:hypothetical protein
MGEIFKAREEKKKVGTTQKTGIIEEERKMLVKRRKGPHDKNSIICMKKWTQ